MKFWYARSLGAKLLAYMLWPLSLLYRIITCIRTYSSGPSACAEGDDRKPTIIVVGNLTAGGTGKTPLCIYLANYFQQQGKQVGIISRGYKSKVGKVPHLVKPEDSATLVGDEAKLLAEAAPLVICPKRNAAIKTLLAHYPATEIIISDDGLQHIAMPRDIEIVVVDADRQFGNGFCLPAGPLREPLSRLNTVDFIVENASSSDSVFSSVLALSSSGAPAEDPENYNKLPELSACAPLCPSLTNLEHNSQSFGGQADNDDNVRSKPRRSANKKFHMHYQLSHYYPLQEPNNLMPLTDLKGKQVYAIAGIGNPDKFFHQLRALGLDIISKAFPDHHAFKASDFAEMNDKPILMTAKDAVKCQAFVKDNFYCVPAELKVAPDFLTSLQDKLSLTLH